MAAPELSCTVTADSTGVKGPESTLFVPLLEHGLQFLPPIPDFRDMATPSVHFRVEHSPQMDRIHVVIRLTLLMALGAIGFSSFYWVAYLALPALAALRIVQKGGERYLAEDAPPIVRVLKWLAGAYAYLWLLTDALPNSNTSGPVRLEVESSGRPAATSALLRLLYSLPAIFVLTVFSLVACLLWVIGAIAILATRGMPRFIADFMTATLRYQFRLIAYHLSLVDSYPAYEEASVAHPSGSSTA
jgi:hypothetical protein